MHGVNSTTRIVLVLGGTRSGKSAVAERLVEDAARAMSGHGHHGSVAYLATGTPDSAGMDERIARHRARRPADWTTVECGVDLPGALADCTADVALVDALGTWVAAHPDLTCDTPALLAALTTRSGVTVIVSEEVGLSVHAPTEVGRRFVDAIGELNQAVAAVADDVGLVVAGRVLWFPAEPEPATEAGPR